MKNLLCLILLLFVAVNGFAADVKPSSVFQDHMVLQRGKAVPVWGTADAGAAVKVTFGGKTVDGKSDAKGDWKVELPSMEANATGQELTIAFGDKTVKLTDVLVGDVWVCSGQSNMEWSMYTTPSAHDDLVKAANPNIRLFLVRQQPSIAPMKEVADKSLWALSSPETAKAFSAVGFLFGEEIQASENVPVGLIGSYWGGTKAECWTPTSALQADPDLNKAYGESAAKNAADGDVIKEAHDKWLADGGKAYKDAMAAWSRTAMVAKNKNEPVPEGKPADFATPEPIDDASHDAPSTLYNGMIHPLQPFAIKGAIWYQGESSAGNPLYPKIFPAMITGWRQTWGQGDFPFLWVQLPNFASPKTDPNSVTTADPNGSPGWTRAREIQADGLKLPATGMAVTIEVGAINNLHPPYKTFVAHRLALAAEHVAYGKDLVYSSPMYESVKFDGANAVVTFKEVGTGLKIGVPPIIPPGSVAPPTDKVIGFAVAGEDKKFFWADASITGKDQVTLTCKDVTAPKYVRYAWSGSPWTNLYNSADLPAAPFRSDLNDMAAPGAKAPAAPTPAK